MKMKKLKTYVKNIIEKHQKKFGGNFSIYICEFGISKNELTKILEELKNEKAINYTYKFFGIHEVVVIVYFFNSKNMANKPIT